MRVSIIVSLLASVCLGACVLHSPSPVEYDYSYQGKFNKYKTYNLFTDLNQNHSPSINTKSIEKIIRHRMQLLGYVCDTISPDILVAYSIYEQRIKLPVFSQPSIKLWMNDREKKYQYNEDVYNLKQGVLLIQIIDYHTIKCVWNGYITDSYRKRNFSDDRHLTQACVKILDQYRFFADGFLDKKDYLVEGLR